MKFVGVMKGNYAYPNFLESGFEMPIEERNLKSRK